MRIAIFSLGAAVCSFSIAYVEATSLHKNELAAKADVPELSQVNAE